MRLIQMYGTDGLIECLKGASSLVGKGEPFRIGFDLGMCGQFAGDGARQERRHVQDLMPPEFVIFCHR